MRNLDELSYKVIGCAIEVHRTLGPGLMESVYEKALMHEIALNNIPARSQVAVKANYKGLDVGEGLRLDLLVDEQLIVELKSVDDFKPVHHKQLLTYLKLMNKQLGLLINFNVCNLTDGVKRIVNNY